MCHVGYVDVAFLGIEVVHISCVDVYLAILWMLVRRARIYGMHVAIEHYIFPVFFLMQVFRVGQSQPQRFDRQQVLRIPTLVVFITHTGFDFLPLGHIALNMKCFCRIQCCVSISHPKFLSNPTYHGLGAATSAFNHLHNGSLIVEFAAMRRLWGCLMLGTTSNHVAQCHGKTHNTCLAL